jgi:IS30 family transposase
MIAATVIDEIYRMLAERRLSQRKIAERLGVSRGTVNAVARGRRQNYRVHRQPRESGFQPPSGRYTRCPSCGGMVQKPCLLCYVRLRMSPRIPRRPPKRCMP